MAHLTPCKECTQDISEMEFQAEIEHLKRHLAERDNHIVAMETEFLKGNTRIGELEDQIVTWKEKYDRLYDSHRRVQRLNQNLEEKLLQMVEKCSDDKSQLTRDVETLSLRLAQSNYAIGHLHKENERFKNDMNLAIQLLQCKPDNFVSQKFDSLPPETQARVSSYIMSRAKLNQEPTQSCHSTGKTINPDDFEFNISASLMSKILEESYHNTVTGHCDTCTCLKKSTNPFSMSDKMYSVATQTNFKLDMSCPHCVKSINNVKCASPFFPNKSATDETNEIVSGFVLSPPPLPDARFLKPVVESLPPKLKHGDEKTKLVSLKHREIMNKIGEDLKDIHSKDRYNMVVPIEPSTGHHRLCDRTKPHPSTFHQEKKHENEFTYTHKDVGKPTNESPVVEKSNLVDPIDVTFGQIENATSIPNTSTETKPIKDTIDLNSNKMLYGSSVSSNDAESKTSSNKSNPKVQIGPGPRFCSLIVQAGSKSILLDNAQPNIAPVLYTRQSRNLESAIPLTYNLNNEMTTGIKQMPSTIDFNTFNSQGFNNPADNSLVPNSSKMLYNIDNILDLPNDDLMIREPIDLSEKPESGYKSNESAEIVDKLLFGSDHMLPDTLDVLKKDEVKKQLIFDPTDKNLDHSLHYDIFEEKINIPKDEMKDIQVQVDSSSTSNKINDSLKLFNFDNYEKTTKHSLSPKIQDCIFDIPNDDKTIKNQSHFIDENPELLNPSFDLKMASKNFSEINKKYQIPVQAMPESTILESHKIREWKKETYTEKSSSSLSSDDSAAILQKQQLLRVAEWVQKNLEMEQQTDLDNSDSCRQSIEEMHHVRNDFPRPAKIDHRIRKNNLKVNHKNVHHLSKNASTNTKENETLDSNSNPFNLSNEALAVAIQSSDHTENIAESTHPENNFDSVNNASNDLDADTNISVKQIKMKKCKVTEKSGTEYTDSNTNSTTKTYTKQELARMEYNVKQFLLNGTRWTKGTADSSHDKARTSSKTETDL